MIMLCLLTWVRSHCRMTLYCMRSSPCFVYILYLRLKSENFYENVNATHVRAHTKYGHSILTSFLLEE